MNVAACLIGSVFEVKKQENRAIDNDFKNIRDCGG